MAYKHSKLGPNTYELVNSQGFTTSQTTAYECFAERLINDLYPRCLLGEIFRTVLPITVGGHSISQTKEKFASKLSTHTPIEVCARIVSILYFFKFALD